MKLAWLTDIHLEFLHPNPEEKLQKFCQTVAATNADVILLGGDIGIAHNVDQFLNTLDQTLQRPIYFVLGNHDYYHGSFAYVHWVIRDVCEKSVYLRWLNDATVIELTPDTALIGHGGWGDGRLGYGIQSQVSLNDHALIADLSFIPKGALFSRLAGLGDEAAEHVRRVLPMALARSPKVIFLTHVPPFREACWHEGQISNNHFLPHFTCKAVGDALREIMTAHPDHELLVLCGHTHGRGETQILPNLLVKTGGAEYGLPEVQAILEIS